MYQDIRLANRINGIVGPRGTGKTTFLITEAIKRGAKKGEALYVSGDNIFFLEHTLFDLATWIYRETDIKYLCIDEIHKYKNWNQELKNISDTYRSVEVLFSGSSMLDMVSSKYDLSRRVNLYNMYGLSFREYLEFYLDVEISTFSLDDIIKQHSKIVNDIPVKQILKHFNNYLVSGYYPYTKELNFDFEKSQTIEHSVQKTIYEDVAIFHDLKTSTLMLIERLFKYLISSSAGELNPSKLASHLGKDFKSVTNYISYLEQAGLLNYLYPAKSGKSHLRNPLKILPENPNLLHCYQILSFEDNKVGKLRETYAVNQLKSAGYDVYYSKQGDFIVDKYHFEIGGKNKSTKQVDTENNGYVFADGIVSGFKNTIPLYLLGLLY